jgi:hypothetical protein
MGQIRQRHIPLTVAERRELDQRKRDYEDRTGDVGDWGKFLGTITLAGLAALGIYSMVQVARRGPTIWQVKCLLCGVMFPVRVPNPPPWRLAQIECPKCEQGLVIDFARQTPEASNRHEERPDNAYIAYCHNCEQPIESISLGINPHEIEYVKCPRCDRVARMRSWE